MRSATPLAAVWSCLAIAITAIAMPTRAAEYFVDNASGTCSPTGPGTLQSPYCSITAALAARHTPGTIITVMPGTYREQVTVSWSGNSSAPITLRAQPSATPVIVDGTDDFSSPAAWTWFFGDVWLAPSVTWIPKQVFADDARLTPSTADPLFLPARSFRYVAGSGLYVNAGGGNPGEHATQVGKRTYGFYASSRSWIRIEGFFVQRAEDRCIQVTNSSNIEILGNRLRSGGKYCLNAQGDSVVRLAANVVWDAQGHGIALTANTVESIVEDNESYGNADPAVRTANGLHLFASSRNVIRRNRWHHNQDTGQHFGSNSHDNLSSANLSYLNGDHGFDHVGATASTHTNDVAWGNFNDGFSLEGGSIETEIHNTISTQNGATTNRFNLFVDTLSTSGFESNDNLFWNANGKPPVRFASSIYGSVQAYADARDHDERTVEADPLFASPATGDFHLTPHSPAIDNANTDASDWPGTDFEGSPPTDDPGMPNFGLGPIPYADRGALEFQGSSQLPNVPPVVQFKLTPSSGSAPLLARADATGSVDPDGGELSYVFDLGDGTVLGPQGWPFADHIYGPGTWTVKVTVTDAGGASISVSLSLTVATPTANAVQDPSFESGIVGWAPLAGATLQQVTGGHTGSKALRVTAPAVVVPNYGITDQPRWVGQAPFLGAQYKLQAWVRSAVGTNHAWIRVRENYDGTSTPWHASPRTLLGSGWTLLQLDYTTQFPESRLALEILNQGNPGTAIDVDDVSMAYVAGTGERGPRQSPTPGASDGLDFAPVLHPNPMGTHGATFRFTTSRPGAVTIHIFDLAGRRVRELVSDGRAGAHVLRFDGRGPDGAPLAFGVYHYRASFAGAVRTGRLVILS